MKRITLDETWKLCLQMWKWIAKESKRKDRYCCVSTLKETWLRENGFRRKRVQSTCFFCEYAVNYGRKCDDCPGKQVNSRFHCMNVSYKYNIYPAKFYKKLLALNKIWLAKKRRKK